MIALYFVAALAAQEPDPAHEAARHIERYVAGMAMCSERIPGARGQAQAVALYQDDGPYMSRAEFERLWMLGLERVRDVPDGPEGDERCEIELSRRARMVEASLRVLSASRPT